MSTRSYIAKQIGEDQYRTIYCHFDGYLTYTGALLLDCYNTPEKVDELLDLGELVKLNQKLSPDPSSPHYSTNEQEGVTIAFARDENDPQAKKAKTMTLAELDAPENWTDYVYIFTRNNVWKYFRAWHSTEGLRDIKEDLTEEYAQWGLSRPEGYYGKLTVDTVDSVKAKLAEQNATQIPPVRNGPHL